MGVVKGIKKYQEYNAAVEAERAEREARRQEAADYVKVDWFGLKNDGDTALVVFPQEMDENAKNFSQKNGVSVVAIEHVNPDNYKRKAVCSIDDEGACFGCEKRKTDGSKLLPDGKWENGRWRQQPRFYTNVLVKQDDGTWVPQVLSTGTGDKSVHPQLFEQAVALDTVTEKVYQIKRKGKEWNKTSYLLTPLQDHDLDVEAYDLFDLSKVYREVPYAKQEAHYLGGTASNDDDAPADEAPKEKDASSDVW